MTPINKSMKRIVKNGVPAYVAPWYSTLTTEGKAMIGQNKIMAPYGRNRADAFTKVEYRAPMTNEEFCRLHAAPYAIAAE